MNVLSLISHLQNIFWLLFFTDMLWHATCIFACIAVATTLHFLQVCSIQVDIMAFPIPCCLLLPYLAVEKDVWCLHI